MTQSTAQARLFGTALAVFGGIVVLQGGLARMGWPAVLPGISLVAGWCLFATLTQPAWAWGHATALGAENSSRRHHLTRLGLLAVLGCVSAFLALVVVYLAWTALRTGQPVPAPGSVRAGGTLERTALISGAAAFLLYFLRQALAGIEALRRSDPRGGLALLLGLLVMQAVGALVGGLEAGRDFARAAGYGTLGVALFLPLEWIFAWALRCLQAPGQRTAQPFSGHSLALAMFTDHSPVRVFAAAVQESFGLEIRGSWLARYARLCLEPLLLILVLAGWLSTSLVLVPPDSEAVRLRWGRFQPATLGPGLHLIAPWPMEQVRILPARRVQEFALGFERDLGGPVLWTEVHFSGESNLLVGNGEEVLTFNVPILFDLADPLATARAVTDPGRFLANLAYRELLLATAPRDGFSIMTSDRDAVGGVIQAGLQSAADRLGLGTRIRHVGLKDIHPPVEVAPAYQEVISAREQRRMMADLAAANRITGLAEARTEAHRARLNAESFAVERVAAVAGEASILTGRVEARRVDPELFDFRQRMLVAEDVMPRLRLILTGPATAHTPAYTLDLREGSNSLP